MKKEIAGKQLCTLDAGDDAVMKRHQMPGWPEVMA